MNKKSFVFISVIISIVIISFIYTLILGYQASIVDETTDQIKSSLQNSTELTYERINKLNGVSQQLIYENALQNLYQRKLKDSITQLDFSRDVSSTLTIKQYPYEEIIMSAVFFNDKSEEIYYSTNSNSTARNIYGSAVHNNILKILENSGSNVSFYQQDGRFYICRNLLNSSKLNKYGGYVLEVDIDYITHYFKSTSSKNIFIEVLVNDQSFVLNENEYDEIIIVDTNGDFDQEDYHLLASAQETTTNGRLFNITTTAYANNIFMYRYEYQFINFYIFAIILVVVLMCWLVFYYIYKNEIAFLDIKVKSLQSQINPHFLNNAFEIINWTARIDGNEEISKMIDALGTVINSSLDRENKRFNTLQEELEIVDSYLFLIQKRFNDRIKIEKSIDFELSKILLPKLTLQPIIENAVKHGIEKSGEGTIFIRVYKKQATVCIEVENNGAVISPEDEKKIKRLLNEKSQSAHIGINNVNTRIKYIFGKNYGLVIKRLENDNSMSKITLPLK